ncbi:ABC transporter ATP-binding protein [Lentzea sp. DG1S-22]|uniref:ABC transporter ATP-binding protein n=1 Tax=Lentzea sp. DG1S-22 TaxID=3108822 RepID=UPI002E7A1B95|nr:ABC transporter ATP-binding protein [Lentzea sp. DG1S-22]WVH81460.1 ABC transporter ATP-binding protein [Lentzea sp. DG1S-22]
MASITAEGLSTVYPGGVRAVDDLDLEIADGELFALLGPSGCGKTTLLRTIAGLQAATGGAVAIGSRDITRLQPGDRRVAMVFQDYALFPHMTVAENIAYPLRVRGAAKSVQRETAARTAAGLSLDGLLGRRPGQLSGGQQQRAALARAVAASAEVLLLDEPLSNLDARLRLEARTFLKKLQRELALTTVFVTHDQAEALALADRIAVMDAGRIRQLGTPREVFQRPADTFVANFIGSTPMNLVPRGSEIIGVRPEYLAPAEEGLFTGVVSIVENLGVTSLVTLDCGDDRIGYVVPEDGEPPVGTTVTVNAPPTRVLSYDRETGLLVR